MRTIIGLIPKRAGRIEVAGLDISEVRIRDPHAVAGRWGILFQQGALFSSLNVRQNIQFPLRENVGDVASVDGRDCDSEAGDGGIESR